MNQRTGLGRGLAALLPPSFLDDAEQLPEEPHPFAEHIASPSVPEVDMADFGAELVVELATNESGIALVYRALDELVEQFELDDAAIVIDENGLGRQVFRAGRRPIEPDDEELLVAEPGLYTDPPLPEDAIDATMLTSLCLVALRLDVLRYDAWHDPLTGLYDRRSFDRLLEMAVARSARYNWPFTLVLIDLDGFKQLNDNEGHAAGDQALRALGERFTQVLRFGDNAARIGGDEFALILPDTDPDDVPMLLGRVATTAAGDAPITAFSYGVAVCPSEADEFDTLFRLADERLYEAKGTRR
ncbi:MAG: diguanylate cyclase [Acidimicrobiia bacterium]